MKGFLLFAGTAVLMQVGSSVDPELPPGALIKSVDAYLNSNLLKEDADYSFLDDNLDLINRKKKDLEIFHDLCNRFGDLCGEDNESFAKLKNAVLKDFQKEVDDLNFENHNTLIKYFQKKIEVDRIIKQREVRRDQQLSELKSIKEEIEKAEVADTKVRLASLNEAKNRLSSEIQSEEKSYEGKLDLPRKKLEKEWKRIDEIQEEIRQIAIYRAKFLEEFDSKMLDFNSRIKEAKANIITRLEKLGGKVKSLKIKKTRANPAATMEERKPRINKTFTGDELLNEEFFSYEKKPHRENETETNRTTPFDIMAREEPEYLQTDHAATPVLEKQSGDSTKNSFLKKIQKIPRICHTYIFRICAILISYVSE